MKLDLNGKVVIVTGGGGAIGSAMCRRFAENGAKVVIAGRTLSKLEAVAEEIRAARRRRLPRTYPGARAPKTWWRKPCAPMAGWTAW